MLVLRAPPHSFAALLQKCLSEDWTAGYKAYDLIVRSGHDSNTYLGGYLIRLFAQHGNLADVNRVFSKLCFPNVFAWTALISANAKFGQSGCAIPLFHQMLRALVAPDGHAYVAVLKACREHAAGGNSHIKLIHAQAFETGDDSNSHVCSLLIDTYNKAGLIEDAYEVFTKMATRDVVAWTAMIAGLADHGCLDDAFELFHWLLEVGVDPNRVTYISMLKACSNMASLERGKLIHANIVERNIEDDLIVGNTLIDMYTKCVCLHDASKVFHGLSRKDLVSWCALITGYAQDGKNYEALGLFYQMQQESLSQNQALFVCILKVCSNLSALVQGKLIHASIMDTDLVFDLLVGNTLVDLYVACGSMIDACKVCDGLPKRDIVTWSTLIAGLARHRNYKLVVHYFEAMIQEGQKPNDVVYLSLLSACVLGSLVKEGIHHFNAMVHTHGIMPTPLHYNCLVDLLAHAGWLNKAEDLLQTMPSHHNIVGWTSLLNCCKMHGQLNLARRCFVHISEIEGETCTGYLPMSSIYAHAGMAEDLCKIEDHTQNHTVEEAMSFEVDDCLPTGRFNDNI